LVPALGVPAAFGLAPAFWVALEVDVLLRRLRFFVVLVVELWVLPAF
jgi:hypothetical protein